jgi:hypothetical protein
MGVEECWNAGGRKLSTEKITLVTVEGKHANTEE